VTEPGEIDKVPIKVVPMYIEPDPAEAVESEPAETVAERPARPKTVLVGALALAASVATVIADAAAIVIATNGSYATATALAWLAIALSVVAVLAGLWAVITHRGRRTGVVAIVVGLVANPLVMLAVLQLVAGAQS
jgi:uncharacterized membrane protein YcjF (UPF0283 family)